MKSMIEVNTNELVGAALDWAVAQAVGFRVQHSKRMGLHCAEILRVSAAENFLRMGCKYSPSTDWSQGGPLIDMHDWALPYRATARYHLGRYESCTPGGFPHNGDTPLIAACRAIVAADQGLKSMIPSELLK
jgi:hypothetical protein